MQVQRNNRDPYEVGQNLKARRTELGLSQDKLADLMGTSRNDVYRHETGKHEMSICTLYQYADALHVDPQQLSPSRFIHDKAVERLNPLIGVASQLSDESLKSLINMARQLQKLESGMQQI